MKRPVSMSGAGFAMPCNSAATPETKNLYDTLPIGPSEFFFDIIKALLVAPLAQLDRASGYEPEGREFESLRARHLLPALSPCNSNVDHLSCARRQPPELSSGRGGRKGSAIIFLSQDLFRIRAEVVELADTPS